MVSRSGRWLRGVALAAVTAGATAPAQAQPPAGPVPADAEAAVAAYLAGEANDEGLEQRAIAAVLAATDKNLTRLGERLRAPGALTEPGGRGLTRLARDVMLRFIDDTRKSGMVYPGQYRALEALQPFAGAELFRLLLQTPDWFADTRRIHLVAPVADLQPRIPEAPILLGITDLIERGDLEPDDLRLALSCLVWQWGRRQYVEARMAELRRQSGEGDAEDRQLALRQLADLAYRVKDYDRAVKTHAALAALTDAARLKLTPNDWYAGACYCALAGKVDEGIA